MNAITPNKEIVEPLDLDEVYREASRHMITAMVGMSLQSAGFSTHSFKQAIAMAQRKAVTLSHEMNRVFAGLSKAGIWHMALKGAVIRDWYPKFGMREMSDIDVLINPSRASDVRDIMVALDYEVKEFDNSIHDAYIKKPLSNFEMHKALMDPSYGKLLYEYYKFVERKLIGGVGTERHFSPEDFYLYMIAHEYKHYSGGGTGLRSLLDTYVVIRHFPNLDWGYIHSEAEKLGVSEFEKDNRTLAQELFSAGEHTVSNPEMLDYILGSGTYGTLQNKVNNEVNVCGNTALGRARYIFHRLFIPMADIKKSFPLFYKHKILIPVLPVYRIIKGRKRTKYKLEMSALRNR